MVNDDVIIKYLSLASLYAKEFSQCRKVAVGSVIVKDNRIVSFGTNITAPAFSCKNIGCLRMALYGDNNKTHRAPGDCRAIHSEVDAIIKAKTDLTGAAIYITRYPCEACARVITDAGITEVYYGREQDISDTTSAIFHYAGVSAYHIGSWKEEDVTT